MAVKSGFFDSVNKDRVYNAEFLALFHAALVGNGIYPNPSNNLKVVERENMTTTVKVGKGWINGHFVINTEDFVLIHDMADGALSRIDRIVLQFDTAGRAIDIVLKKGAFSSNPVAPAVIRDVDYYELVLADVRINGGQIQIIQGSITDQRLNNALCGVVHNYIDQVDTTDIFNQYQSWFNDYSVTKASEFLSWQTNVTTALEAWIDAQELGFEAWRQAEEDLYYAWLEAKKSGFDSWFATIQDILDTNAAGNLLQLIDEHKDAEFPHLTTDKQYQVGIGYNNELNCVQFIFKAVE